MTEDTAEKKEPWLVVLMKGQITNKHAELLGKGPWWMFVVVVFLTAMLAASPIASENGRFALESTNPALYPGLDGVFAEIQQKGWELKVDKGFLVTGAGVPSQTRIGDWLVVFEPAGGNSQALQEAVGTSGTTIIKVAFFGRTNLGLIDQETEKQFNGTWDGLPGFQIPERVPTDPAQLTALVLAKTATARIPQTTLMTELFMFVQVTMLTVVLGFLLSLSKVHIRGTFVGQKRAAGFLASLRTAGFIGLGPALLTAVVFSLIPGSSGLAFVTFTLLFGGRIVLIYMARFRNKNRQS